MKKSVVVNGQKKQVEYIVISRRRIADYSKPSKKYSNCIAFDYINEWTISIDGKEAKSSS